MISKNFFTDVLVVGGGIAGVAVAVTAARNGMKTTLVESQGTLGGLGNQWLCDGHRGHGGGHLSGIPR